MGAESVDLFDGKNDDEVLVKDCDGNMHPHSWIGDGSCDDGLNSEHCCFPVRGRAGRLSTFRVYHSASVLCGAFV